MVWAKIKKRMTENTRPGSTGYQMAVAEGAMIFSDIADHLADKANEIAEFDKDTEVTNALFVNSRVGALKRMGIIH